MSASTISTIIARSPIRGAQPSLPVHVYETSGHGFNNEGGAAYDAPSAELARRRAAMLESLRAYFAANGFDANWDAIEGMADDELVITLCMVCPFDPAEKQALLEAATPVHRADTLITLLQMGAHGSPSAARSSGEDDDTPRTPS